MRTPGLKRLVIAALGVSLLWAVQSFAQSLKQVGVIDLPVPVSAVLQRPTLRPLTYDDALEPPKTIIEGPDPARDRIIRSVRESHGVISGKLRKEHPLLERPEIAEEIVRAIREELPWTPDGDPTTKAPEVR
jgi:hypothetical protein